jgi:CDP-diglyceride synthetase
MLAWESTHFDFIITSNSKWEDFFKAKYYLIVIPTVALYFLTIPYIYYGKEIFWLNLAAMIYNVGVNANLLLYTASFNKKRMELAKGAMMNYQGVGINNFIMALPLMVGPIFIFLPFKLIWGYEAGVIALAVLGIIGLSLHRIIIRSAVKLFESKRYEIAEGYRNKA